MTAPLTDEQLAAIEARLAAATPGPWEDQGGYYVRAAGGSPCFDCKIGEGPIENVSFIAHAPADIAALLADNARLRAEVARLKLAILKGVNQRHWGGCMHVMREALGDDEVNRMLNTVNT